MHVVPVHKLSKSFQKFFLTRLIFLSFYKIFLSLLQILFAVAVLDYDDDEGEEGDEYYDDNSAGGKGEIRCRKGKSS